MDVVVACDGIGKIFRRRQILRDVSFQVSAGEVYGLCGPNGAGKTTLLKIVSGLVRPSAGRVTYAGGKNTVPCLGVVTENPPFILEVSGLTNLRLLASIRNRASDDMIRATIRRVGLDPGDRRPVGHYSLGMRQRLGLAQALIESPELLLLDEPTNGLDPLGIRQVQEIIAAEARRGTAVIVASHLLSALQHGCHRVGIMDKGRLVRELNMGEQAGALRLTVTTDADWETVGRWPSALATHRDPGAIPRGLVYTDLCPPEAIRELIRLGVSVEAFYPYSASLEDTFLRLFEEEARGHG